MILVLCFAATLVASKSQAGESPSFQSTLERYDVDGDGLEKNEVEATVMRRGFMCLDTDRSGSVSDSEWSQLFERYSATDLYGHTAAEVADWLRGCRPLHQMEDVKGASRALEEGNVGGLKLFKLTFLEPWRLKSDFGLTADDADMLVMAVCGITKGRPCDALARPGWLSTWGAYLSEKAMELFGIIFPMLMILRVLGVTPAKVLTLLSATGKKSPNPSTTPTPEEAANSPAEEVPDLPQLILLAACSKITVYKGPNQPKKRNMTRSSVEVTEEGVRIDGVEYYKFDRHEIRHVPKSIVHGQHFQIRTRIGGLSKGVKHASFYLLNRETEQLRGFIRERWGGL